MNDVMNENNILKQHEFIKPEIDEVDFLLDKVIKDCKKKFFHTFKYKIQNYTTGVCTQKLRNMLKKSSPAEESKPVKKRGTAKQQCSYSN